MILITLIICIGLQWYFNIGGKDHGHTLMDSYISKLEGWLGQSSIMKGYLGLVVIILPLLLVLALVLYLIGHISLLEFVTHIAIVFYCLQATNYRTVLADFFEAIEDNDEKEAIKHGQDFIDDRSKTDLKAVTEAVDTKILTQSAYYFFSVVFWYLLLGVVGAALYYIVAQVCDSSNRAEGKTVKNILDWVPARFLGLSFSLVGHFIKAFQTLWQQVMVGLDFSDDLVYEVAMSAVDQDKDTKRLIGLVESAAVVWIVAIALFTLGALIS